jgi:hypothetical protein
MNDGGLLLRVQRLQFSAKSEAEALLLAFVRETFPQLDVIDLELRPQAISLNSFNGFLTLHDGSRLFFKTHIEHDNVISEYYNAEMLAAAGYPVIQPLYGSTHSGQQLLIYPIVDAPSVFDVARAIERAEAFDSPDAKHLVAAQHEADDELSRIYAASMELQPAAAAEQSPVHQLFWHRLTGGRYERFYNDYAKFALPHGQFDARSVFGVHWAVNGSLYGESLITLVSRAIEVLHPAQSEYTVIGHGDAHNGNVFLTDAGLVYFDPAFAGRHSPLLDLVKPMFHNVFAMWMYFPAEERDVLKIAVEVHGDTWTVSHDYANNALRRMFFESKLERAFIPALNLLHKNGGLRSDWREQFKLALMCCPLLTMNLTAFPPEIALLGLCFAVQMGAESMGERSMIDAALDRAASALAE